MTSKPYLLLSSNVCVPSPEDTQVTERLKDACTIIGIDLLDHLIIGTDTFKSLKEANLL